MDVQMHASNYENRVKKLNVIKQHYKEILQAENELREQKGESTDGNNAKIEKLEKETKHIVSEEKNIFN